MSENKFLVEVSARHVHLSQKDVEILFGEGATLTKVRDLSQPGEHLCEQRVDVIGPKREFKNVAILGPTRPNTQIELALTDCFFIGQPAPIRESGDVEGSSSVTLRGTKGELKVEQGLIVAQRHIHLTPESAEEFGVVNKQIVWVEVETDRPVVFGDVVCRVSPKYATAMHVDTDEGNAAGIPRSGCQGFIIKE